MRRLSSRQAEPIPELSSAQRERQSVRRRRLRLGLRKTTTLGRGDRHAQPPPQPVASCPPYWRLNDWPGSAPSPLADEGNPTDARCMSSACDIRSMTGPLTPRLRCGSVGANPLDRRSRMSQRRRASSSSPSRTGQPRLASDAPLLPRVATRSATTTDATRGTRAAPRSSRTTGRHAIQVASEPGAGSH
jgi:hypothetical protein